MKKLGFYAAVVIAVVFTLWFATKDGMRPSEGAAPPEGSVGCVMLESLSMGRRVSVEDPEDIERLSGTLSVLSEENGVVVDLEKDFPESMRDWTIEWLSPEEERLALVEINRAGTVFRGDQCFNFLGGEIFDMDYLRGLLLGLPEAGDSEVQLIDPEAIEWANLYGGDASVKTAAIRGEALEELKTMLSGMSFHKGERAQETIGCGYALEFFDRDGREMGRMELHGDSMEFCGYYYQIDGGRFDDEWIKRMLDTMPEATYGERFPIVDFKYDGDIFIFAVSRETADGQDMVRITDPELLERLESPIREMEFRACEPCESRELAYWVNRTFADGRDAFAVQIIDEKSIWFSGWRYELMDGRRFDLELYARLMDPEGPYKDHVEYWRSGDPPLPAVTPIPGPSEPAPAGTAVPYVMEDPPQERHP